MTLRSAHAMSMRCDAGNSAASTMYAPPVLAVLRWVSTPCFASSCAHTRMVPSRDAVAYWSPFWKRMTAVHMSLCLSTGAPTTPRGPSLQRTYSTPSMASRALSLAIPSSRMNDENSSQSTVLSALASMRVNRCRSRASSTSGMTIWNAWTNSSTHRSPPPSTSASSNARFNF